MMSVWIIICSATRTKDRDRVDGRMYEPGTESLTRFAISRKPRGRGGAAASSTREGPGLEPSAHNRSGCVDGFDEDRGGRRKLVSSSITASGHTMSPKPILAPLPRLAIYTRIYPCLESYVSIAIFYFFLIYWCSAFRFGVFDICLLFGVTSNRPPLSIAILCAQSIFLSVTDVGRYDYPAMPIPSIRASYRPDIVRRT